MVCHPGLWITVVFPHHLYYLKWLSPYVIDESPVQGRLTGTGSRYPHLQVCARSRRAMHAGVRRRKLNLMQGGCGIKTSLCGQLNVDSVHIRLK